MNDLNLNKWIKLSIIAGMLLISIAIFYYFVIFLPQQEKLKLKRQNIRQDAEEYKKSYNERMLDACLGDAYTSYINTWNENCKTAGINHKDSGCSLPISLADSHARYYKDLKEECFKRYPVK